MTPEIKELHEKIDEIKSNHLTHLALDIQTTKTNVDWLMKFFWIVATASVGGLVTSIINLILK